MMTKFEVWAPNRSQMSVVVDGTESPMERYERGWWVAVVRTTDDCDYIFQLDNENLLPDPRSRFQPEGVHGVSRLVNPENFVWTDEGFRAPPLASAIIYELHVGTFTPEGTFEAVVDKLNHLTQLGVTHVELMPVAEFAGERGWGYDGVYPYAAKHAYGGPFGLQRLVDACHAEGLAVMLDVVYNHLGPAGNYLPQFGPYFSERHKTPWGSAINFDGSHSDEVRRYFIDNAKMWLRDYHFDGLRLDAIHAIVDTSAVTFLEQLADEVKQLEAHVGRNLQLIAESDLNDPRVIRSRDCGGCGFDAQWSDDFHHALHVALSGESHGYYSDFQGLSDLATVFTQPFLFGRRFSAFRQRSHGRAPVDLPASKFLAYSQNHDQVGNRAIGERLEHLIGFEKAKIAAAVTLLSPYVPMLFQGEEWAASSPFQYFVDFADDAALARAVSEGRRSEFSEFDEARDVPDPQDSATFSRSKLDWAELDNTKHREMLEWYEALIALRRRLPSLVDGAFENISALYDEVQNWLTIRHNRVQILINLAPHAREFELNLQAAEILLASNPSASIGDSSAIVPSNAVMVIQIEASPPQPSSRESDRTGTSTNRSVATAK